MAGEDHEPLGVEVHGETRAFVDERFDSAVLLRLKVTNRSAATLTQPCVGLHMTLATGYKDPDEQNWERGWFGNQELEFFERLRLVTEHHFDGDGGRSPSWGGVQILTTAPTPIDELTVSFNYWRWADEIARRNNAPWYDEARWDVMTNGIIASTDGSQRGLDPVELLSVGPFPDLAPGDSFEVDFAFVGGREDIKSGRSPREDIVHNAEGAFLLVGETPPGLAVGLDSTSASPVEPKTPQRDMLRPAASPRGTASILFESPSEAHYRADLHDIAGRRVATVRDGNFREGNHLLRWDGRDVSGSEAPSGVYFLRLSSADGVVVATSRVVLIR